MAGTDEPGPWTADDRAWAASARRDANDRLAVIESALAATKAYADAILDRLNAALDDTCTLPCTSASTRPESSARGLRVRLPLEPAGGEDYCEQ